MEDVDNEKRDNIQADAAGLHRFYSKHMDFPDSKELLSLFSQVKTFNKKKAHDAFMLSGPVFVSFYPQVSCNGFTIEDEELSHIGTAVYPE